MPEPSEHKWPTPAEPDLSSLAVMAMGSLYEAEMFEEMEMLRSRVLGRGAAMFDQVQGHDGAWHISYKPMVELLFLHVREIAIAPRPVDVRRRDIAWAIKIAGF